METVIYITIAFCVILAIALAGVLIYTWYRDNKKFKSKSTEDSSRSTTKAKSSESQTRLQGIESMSKFLAFDDIVDSMIVRKNRTQYVMVMQCKGINFDLLGEDEKMAVESGFVQFLNTLRYPVQLYIQSRSLNLKDSVDKYQAKVNEVKEELIKIDNQIRREKANGRLDLVRKLEFERKRKQNIVEYGMDITNYVDRLSQNRNVLQQNTYVAVAYYTNEFGGQISNYSKEEIDNIAFSELYTRAQTIIRALSSSGVTARVMNSEELAELLYVAYNRDDSELINVRRAVEAQYDSLYNTAKDIMDKQKEMIEKKVEQEAIDLTADSITKADRIIKLRRENKEEIRRRALAYVERYKGEMTDDLYEETKRQVNKAKIEDIDGKENGKKEADEEQERLARREKARKEIEEKEAAERRELARRRRAMAERKRAQEGRTVAQGNTVRRTRPNGQQAVRRKPTATAEE